MKRPLRTILTAQTTLTAIIPVLVIVIIGGVWLLPQKLREIEREQLQLARAISSQVESQLETFRLAIASIGGLELDDQLGWHNMQHIVDSAMEASPALQAIYITTPDGTVKVARLRHDNAIKRQDVLNIDLSRNSLFTEARSSGKETWSDSFLSLVSGSAAVAVAVPSKSKVVIGEIALDRLTAYLSTIALPSEQLLLVIDRRGQVIADPHGRLTAQQINLNSLPIVASAIVSRKAQTGYFHYDGQEMIGSIIPIASNGWQVLVAEEKKRALQSLRASVYTVAVGSTLALLFGSLTAMILSRRLAHRFELLAATARDIAYGKKISSWPAMGQIAEFSDLSANFAAMAEKLRNNQLFLNDLIENSGTLIFAKDLDGRYELVNRKWEEVTGLSRNDVIGRKDDELFPAAAAAIFMANDQEVIRSREVCEIEENLEGADGARHFLSVKFPLRDENGVISGICGVTTEITARKQAEMERQRIAKELELIMDSTTDGIHGVALDGTIFFENRASEIMFGYERGELLGKVAHPLIHHHHQDGSLHPIQECPIYKSLADGLERTVVDDLFWRKDGSFFHTEYSVKPIRDSDGTLAGVLVTLRDVTARKRLEEQLRQSQKMESIGRLAGGIAHDFNNKLTVIMGNTELARMTLPEGHKAGKYLGEIFRAAEHSRDITAQLLAFSRQQLSSPRVLDVNRAITDARNSLVRLIGEDVLLTLDLADNLWNIRMDPVQVDQILMNLAVNAKDAMPDGGTIAIGTANRNIDEWLCRNNIDACPGDFVEISFGDDGCGMPKEVLQHIFDPFFTTKEVGKGTGLGLATIYGIVTQNKGFINVYSEQGHGTLFKIYLPRHDAEPAGSSAVQEEAARPVAGSVLLVEDDDAVRSMTGMMLEELGLNVHTTGSPSEAVRMVDGTGLPIDVLITDVIMPEMNGRKLAELIQELRPGTRVLFMSGYSSQIIAGNGVMENEMNYIQKPFGLTALRQKLLEIMASHDKNA